MTPLTKKEREMVEACCFEPRYGGDHSRRIWDAVTGAEHHQMLYGMGVILQDIEDRFLALLNQDVRGRAETTIRTQRARVTAKQKGRKR